MPACAPLRRREAPKATSLPARSPQQGGQSIHHLSCCSSPTLGNTGAQRGQGTGPKTHSLSGAQPFSESEVIWAWARLGPLRRWPGGRPRPESSRGPGHSLSTHFLDNPTCRSWEPKGPLEDEVSTQATWEVVPGGGVSVSKGTLKEMAARPVHHPRLCLVTQPTQHRGGQAYAAWGRHRHVQTRREWAE